MHGFRRPCICALAAFAATGFAVAGVHALMVVRRKNIEFHTKAFRIAALFGMHRCDPPTHQR